MSSRAPLMQSAFKGLGGWGLWSGKAWTYGHLALSGVVGVSVAKIA